MVRTAPWAALENVPDSVPVVETNVATSPLLRATQLPLLRPWPTISLPPSVMLPLALSCENEVPGVAPFSSMNVLVVVDELSVAVPVTARVVVPVLVEFVPIRRVVPLFIVSGPD